MIYHRASRLLSFILMMNITGSAAISCEVELAKNKKLVQDFYQLAFNKHQPVDAAKLYLSEKYIQHNPHVATGRQAFIEAFKDEFKNPEEQKSKSIFKRLIAEGDLVMLHSHKLKNETDRGVAGIDIFRIKNGKIAEHWDVNQAIPEKAANSNTMF